MRYELHELEKLPEARARASVLLLHQSSMMKKNLRLEGGRGGRVFAPAAGNVQHRLLGEWGGHHWLQEKCTGADLSPCCGPRCFSNLYLHEDLICSSCHRLDN